MLAIISPAKKLDFTPNNKNTETSNPAFLSKSSELIDILKNMEFNEIQKLMKLSDKLTQLNQERYHDFSTPFTLENSKQAIYSFQGDTYVGLAADSLSNTDINYAQNHLRILSGLYGLLKPLDLIQAYRLEMGTALKNEDGNNLYKFWGDALTNACNEITKSHSDPTIVCLASNEYSKAINIEKLNSPFLNCHFKENKDGKLKVIGLFAKRARGMMARYMIQNKIENTEELKNFNEDGYKFSPELSSESDFVFIRTT